MPLPQHRHEHRGSHLQSRPASQEAGGAEEEQLIIPGTDDLASRRGDNSGTTGTSSTTSPDTPTGSSTWTNPTTRKRGKSKEYTARKKMKVDGQQLKPGDVVPGAGEWLRVESWVRAGFLNEV